MRSLSPTGTECAPIPLPLNILIVIHTPKNPYTAVFNGYQQLADFLRRRGHRVTILAPEDSSWLRRVHARWLPLLYPVWVASWLRRMAGKFDLALFHSYSGWLVQWMRRWIRAYQPMRVLTAFHGLEPVYYARLLEEGQHNGNPLRFRFRLVHGVLMPLLLRIGCRRSDHILCLNSVEADYLERNQWGTKQNIAVIPNGVPRQFFVERDYRREARRLLFVGQWLPRKGIDYLVQAFSTLSALAPNLELRCVGTIVDEPHVLASFPVEIRDRVSVRPQAPRPDLVAEYEQADVFLFPTLMEGFSVALLEAMASGLPIVTTPVGAVPDLLVSGENALLVPTRDPQSMVHAVQQLANDPALREKLGRSTQALARRFVIDAVHQNVETIFEMCCHTESVLSEAPQC